VYEVALAVINEMGCIDTIIQLISVTIEDPYYFFIPNSFTPNGDGLNDVFTAKGENIKTFEMYIYNRWGEIVYSTTNFTEAWDGKTVKENEAIQGVYVYLMKVSNTRNKEYVYRGSVSLIR
jgi:gliding motility-associated-like protein